MATASGRYMGHNLHVEHDHECIIHKFGTCVYTKPGPGGGRGRWAGGAAGQDEEGADKEGEAAKAGEAAKERGGVDKRVRGRARLVV